MRRKVADVKGVIWVFGLQAMGNIKIQLVS